MAKRELVLYVARQKMISFTILLFISIYIDSVGIKCNINQPVFRQNVYHSKLTGRLPKDYHLVMLELKMNMGSLRER